MLRDYENKVAVVTGAAGGLGRALAYELARRGCDLALVDSDAQRLHATAEELRGLRAVSVHVADVSSQPAVQAVAAEIVSAHARVNLLINNAGVSISAPFRRTTPEAFERVFGINFLGVVYGCRAFLPILQQQPDSQILNVSSCFAWLGYPGKTAYAASKAAVRSFSESLRMELESTHVGVTVLYPGPMHTNIVRHGMSDSEESRLREERFLQSRGIPPDVVAQRALTALKTNPSRIVVGLDYRVMDFLARLPASFAQSLIGIAARRTGF